MMTCRRDGGFPSLAHGAGGEMLMYRHGGTCLDGPVSQARVWWFFAAGETETATDLALAASPPPEAAAGEDIRHDLVARVRREIAEGTYDTPDKWEIALARLCYRLEQ
jgi:hypothetical protein